MNNSLNCNLVFLSISISFVFLIYLRPELLSTLEHVLKKVRLDSLAIASLTYVIGNGFNTVVALGADHPNLLQAALKSFPPPAEEQPFCPTGL